MDTILKCIQDQIASYKFGGYDSEKENVKASVLQTIEFGLSTTVLVIGPQGVGKTTMVNTILDEIEKIRNIEGQYQVIKFNGYLQETDELAVRHIVKSLNRNLVSENEFKGTSLEYLKYVTESLRQADGSKKALVMVFDNFHVFCGYEKQLLYNLLDMVNHKSAAICLIGVTRNEACLEALHERTQSRLATTNIYLYPKTSVADRLALIRRLFIVKKSVSKKNWNKLVEQICLDSEMEELIKNLLENNMSEGFFLHFLHHTLLYIDNEDSLNIDVFKNAYNDFVFDTTKLDYELKNLTTLDLGLVIAIYHRCMNHGTNSFNFEMIYEYYKKVAQKVSGKLPSNDRLVAMKAFQNLQKHGYMRLKRSGNSDLTPIEYDVHELLIPIERIKDCIRNLSNLSADLQQWIENSLHTQ